ncbi:unnamed protein product [Effrenium voratum]|uniref:Uncharacterized protein n=1 Tax=Effrenium voratum TaxID=2562239 RepID=A0AA36NF64_9DINO|nr:unnamed protein product [Effrenium voratum]
MKSRVLLLAAFVSWCTAQVPPKAAKATVAANGGLTLVQKRNVLGKMEPSLLQGQSISSGEAVRLRTLGGKYLRCDGNQVRIARKGSNFHLKGSGTFLQSGDEVELACAGRRVAFLQEKVVAHLAEGGADRPFIVQRQDGDGLVRDQDAIFLLDHQGLALQPVGATLQPRMVDASGEVFLVERMDAPSNRWVVVPDPDHYCDPTLECHRKLNVSCSSPNGTQLSLSQCDHASRPWSYEPCFRSPAGSCIDVALSDCVDISGSWWNADNKTCSDYSNKDCAQDELVQRACGQTCGRGKCNPRKTPPVKGSGCKDDPLYRSAFNWHCAWFVTRNCSEYIFKEELLQACPKSCKVC